MSNKLFGTDGIRGAAGQYPFNQEGSVQIGLAVGTHFANMGRVVLLGEDTRESSSQLGHWVSQGLMASGVDVQRIGVAPTPALAYLTRETKDAAAGFMITASHNPFEDNGFKIFSGNARKLDDATEDYLTSLIRSALPHSTEHGQLQDGLERIHEYEDFLVSTAVGPDGNDLQLDGLRLAIDTANGAASGLAQRVFRDRFGAMVVSLGDQPDGRNINKECGATDLRLLQRTVLDKDAGVNFGIAFDGDADRIQAVDEHGRIVDGDHILGIMAGEYDGVVGTSMTNGGLEKTLRQQGKTLLRTDVGDRYVLDGMEESGFDLGGEQSGHIVQRNYLFTGDGLLAAIHLAKTQQTSGQTLGQLRDSIALLEQHLESRTALNKDAMDHPDVQAIIEAERADLGGDGRVDVRPSGTQQMFRVMIEGPAATERANRIADRIAPYLN